MTHAQRIARCLLALLLLASLVAQATRMPSNTVYVGGSRGAVDTQLGADRARRRAQTQALTRWRDAMVRKGALSPRTVLPRFDTFVVNSTAAAQTRSTGTRQAALGMGEFTFAYDGFQGYENEQQRLDSFLTASNGAYQEMIKLFGAPADVATVKITRDPALTGGGGGEVSYDGTTHTIDLRIEPVPAEFPGLDAQSFELDLLTMLAHAFHEPAVIGFDAWEEGLARAAAILTLARVHGDVDLNYILEYLLPVYDCLNQRELASPTFFHPQGLYMMRVWRVGMALSAWLKVYTENQDAFRAFHAAYYAQYAANPAAAGNLESLKSLMAGVVPGGVEGSSFTDWYSRQYVLQPTIVPGQRLYVSLVPQDDAASLMLHYYQVGYTTGDGGTQQVTETPLGGTANLTYTSYDGLDITDMPEEGHQVTISATEVPTMGVMAGVSPFIVSFYNIGGPQRLKVGVTLGGQQRDVYYAYKVRGPDNAENALFGTVVGSDGGNLAIDINGGTYAATVDQGVFNLPLTGNFPFFARIAVTYTATDGHQVQFRRNVGPGFYAVVAVDSAATVLQRRFTTGLSMVSFPLTPADTDAMHLFYPSGGAVNFRMAWWDPTAAEDPVNHTRYRYYHGDGTLPVTAGNGYWVDLTQDRTVQLTGAPPADPSVVLHPGWNMVGNVYASPLNPWAMTVQNVGGGVAYPLMDAVRQGLVSPLWQYDTATGAYVTKSSLDGWEGAWVYNPTLGDLVLHQDGAVRGARGRSLTAPTFVGTPEMQTLTALTGGQWGIPISVQSGTASDTLYLGLAQGARQGMDGLDWLKPPAMQSPIRAAFIHPERRASGAAYASDMRQTIGLAGEQWEFEVTSTAAGRVTLAWPDMRKAKSKYAVVLEDLKTGTRQSLGATTSYIYVAEPTPTTADTRRFRLTATPAQGALLQMSDVRATAVPGAGANVAFTLSQSADVTLQIRTVTGQIIRNLRLPNCAAGVPTVLPWDGRNAEGKLAGRMNYLCMLVAKSGGVTFTRVLSVRLQ